MGFVLAGAAAIALAFGLGVVLRRFAGWTPWPVRTVQALTFVAALVASSHFIPGASLWPDRETKVKRDTDATLAKLREAPMIGVILADNPEVESELRAAITRQAAGTKDKPGSLAWKLGAELRRRYVVPALSAADDLSALQAVAALHELIKYLKASDYGLCRDLALTGLENPSRLDPRAADLFKASLVAQEAAYRSGKGRPIATPPGTIVELLRQAGYNQSDFDDLDQLAKASVEKTCAVAEKLYRAAGTLPPAAGAALARQLLVLSP